MITLPAQGSNGTAFVIVVTRCQCKELIYGVEGLNRVDAYSVSLRLAPAKIVQGINRFTINARQG